MSGWRRSLGAIGGIVALLGGGLCAQAGAIGAGLTCTYGAEVGRAEVVALAAIGIATILLGVLAVREASRPSE